MTKQRYVRIAAIVAMRLKEDEASSNVEQLNDESPATYKGAYLIISNRHDAPKEALQTYVKRWRIEVFFVLRSKNWRLKSATLNPRRITMLILSCCLPQKPC
ncbi:hypothetical protein BC351_21515 [Paenibacillus ferrarius]|uniref:Transposase IS4-like domain-containing protein n=1 Tax=Paenibacillus ferrarius TaxID=1469647 RepID=A0A1V4HNU5_9BACL|nr:hypothetical protein [Paenibacillus ferrarius]OPH58923.1 hypothetical protein BC351_21515 [Paenibacillus ferrarius]